MSFNPKQQIEPHTISKLVCLGLTVFGNIHFLLFALQFPNFLADTPTIPAVSTYNVHLNEVTSQNKANLGFVIMFDIGLIVLFWLQHVLMARKTFIRFMISKFPQYIFIEKAVYLCSAYLLFKATMAYWIPIHVFDFTMPFSTVPFFLLTQVGTGLFAFGLFQQFKSDLTGPAYCYKVLTMKSISFEERYSLPCNFIVTNRLYSYMRHPIYSGIIMLYLFASTRVNLGRLIFIGLQILAIWIGVYFEEKDCFKNIKGYKEYAGQVKNKFIPQFGNTLKQN